MPRKKVAKKNNAKGKENTESFIEKRSIPAMSNSSSSSQLVTPRNIILIIILVIALLLWKFKGSFIAAMVNGQPISRWQLNDQLVRKFGDQMLENIINERLILSAARQKGIIITSQDIDTKIQDIEKRLAGQTTLDEALKAQGMAKEEFRRQIEIQLSIDKLFDNEATVSGGEIDEYISKNAQAYKNATDPAALRKEVTDLLKQQKVSDLFEKWFSEVKKSASVKKFI